MDEAELAKIKKALEEDTTEKACREIEKVLLELGYYRAVPCK